MRMPLLFALLLTSTTPLLAQPASQSAPSAVDIATARAFLDILDPGKQSELDAFIADRISPRAAEFEPPEQLAARIRALAGQSGGIAVSEWNEVGDQVRFAGTSRRGAIPVRGIIGLTDGKLVGFQIGPDRRARGADAPEWPASAASADAALAAIERELEWRARSSRFSGAVVISRRGEPVLERAYGLARRSPDVPATTDTPFHTASTTKMFTAAAIAQLIDAGRIRLDMTVAEAVPALAASPGAGQVRIRDLLGHRVSYGDYILSPEYRAMERDDTSATELLALIADREPRPAREGRISYSNANYLVLAAAIEAASGQSYYDYVETHLLRPLGMTNTLFGAPAARPSNAAVGWIKDDVTDPLGISDWRANDGVVPYRGGPPGGTWASARDMSRFIQAFAAGRIASPATIEAMLGDLRTSGRTFRYGLGFMVNEANGRTFFGHDGGGGNAGVSTSVFTSRDGAWSVAVLSNFSSPAGDDLGKTLMDLLLTVPE
ncbi:serine hydrolase domain-containing protein [Sphingosinicella sp. YJ22]|uniref:serine hydrolase domain-containing protein n=1 Tax=Sphingosinicella sp. YJ22 TaxID=1104780 RepID=UPI00140D5C6D|nr:serine hydrolase domain-containing protein [Sphingosinicella sp. YJ22]